MKSRKMEPRDFIIITGKGFGLVCRGARVEGVLPRRPPAILGAIILEI